MRSARRIRNERRRGSEIQLAVTRKPLIAKKTATAMSPNSGPSEAPERLLVERQVVGVGDDHERRGRQAQDVHAAGAPAGEVAEHRQPPRALPCRRDRPHRPVRSSGSGRMARGRVTLRRQLAVDEEPVPPLE